MLAQALGGEYVALDDLDETSLTIRIQGRLKSL
jgi:Mg-chelatase subunit ChlD